jgi:phosphatidate cytidylyltransferase
MSADYMIILIVMPFLAVIGMLGDLCMSAVKRWFGVKDFGSIMPGHGGVLDRFDSVLFTLPAVYALIQCFPVVFLN